MKTTTRFKNYHVPPCFKMLFAHIINARRNLGYRIKVTRVQKEKFGRKREAIFVTVYCDYKQTYLGNVLVLKNFCSEYYKG